MTRWTWRSSAPLAVGDFGAPQTATGYELCVFDIDNLDPVTFTPSLMFAASLPAGSDWKEKSTGFVYKNAADKIRVRLKSGATGEAKIVARAKSPANPVEYLPPVGPSVLVQLRTAAGVLPAKAYFSFYQYPVTSTEKHYKAQFPGP